MTHSIKVNNGKESKWPSRPEMNVDAHTKPAVQSDWNQNDESASDYVKNRPFYTEITEQSLSGFDGWNAAVGCTGPIPKVSVDGVIYEDVPESYVNEYTIYYIVGNYKITINMMSSDMTIAMANGDALTGTPPTIEFITTAESVTSIDEKFLPYYISELNVGTVQGSTVEAAVIKNSNSSNGFELADNQLKLTSCTPESTKLMGICVDDDGAIKTYGVNGAPTNWATTMEVVVNHTSSIDFCGVNNSNLTFTKAKALYAKNRPYLVFNGEPFIAAEITENSVTVVYMGKGEDGQYGIQKSTFGNITWKTETT